MTEFACNCQPLASRLARRAASLTQQASSSAACVRLQPAQRARRARRGALRCSAGMGIGFRDREAEDVVQTPELLLAESGIRVPKAAYGLSVRQIAALGLAGGESALKLGEPSPVRQTREARPVSALSVHGDRARLRRCSTYTVVVLHVTCVCAIVGYPTWRTPTHTS
jgi:hypothetical protein